MKTTIIAFLIILLVSCRIENHPEEISNSSSSSMKTNQIAIGTNNISSEDVREFVEEITARQKASPDAFFEVVRRDNINEGSAILSRLTDNHLYKNKNFYIFIGLGTSEKDKSIKSTDWNAIYRIMDYVSNSRFRVLINVSATAEHLKLASEDADTSVILWSSHGNKKAFYDHDGEPVPYDVFEKKHADFYQFILSSCEGRTALNNHYGIENLVTWGWSGNTTSDELAKFLVSDDWSAFDGKSLSSPVKGYTCTASGANFKIMKVENRDKVDDETYSTLEECDSALKDL